MTRRHILLVSAILGLAAVTGLVALRRTLEASTGEAQARAAVVATRTRQLDRLQDSIRQQLAASARGLQTTPSTGSTAARVARAQRILYVRPAPIVVRAPQAGGEHDDAVEDADNDTERHEDERDD